MAAAARASASRWSIPAPVGEGASFGNAGNISPGAVVPYTDPGVLQAKLPGWLLDPEGPLAVRPGCFLQGAAVAARRGESRARRKRRSRPRARCASCIGGTFEAYDALTRGTDAEALIERCGQLYVSEKPERGAGLAARAVHARGGRREDGRCSTEREIRDVEPTLAPIFKSGMLLPDNGRCKNPHQLVQVSRARPSATARRSCAARSPVSRPTAIACTRSSSTASRSRWSAW